MRDFVGSRSESLFQPEHCLPLRLGLFKWAHHLMVFLPLLPVFPFADRQFNRNDETFRLCLRFAVRFCPLRLGTFHPDQCLLARLHRFEILAQLLCGEPCLPLR